MDITVVITWKNNEIDKVYTFDNQDTATEVFRRFRKNKQAVTIIAPTHFSGENMPEIAVQKELL